jgi:MoaA/NifB/PqqE/SkfB family radical SAM enzyme
VIKGIEVHKKSYSLKWDIENRCNLKCKHCMLSEVTYKPECTLNENKLFLKRLIDLGLNQVLFMSKEPLLYNSIEELVKYAHNRGVGTGIITNGTLLTYSKVEKLLKAGLDTLIISLEGVDSVTNDYIRGTGTYKKVINALKIVERVFREYNKSFRLALEYTINKNNLHEPPRLIEFLNYNLFEIVNVGAINLIGEAKRYKEIVPDETEVLTYIKDMMLEYKRIDMKRYTIFSKSLYPYQIIKLNTCFGIDLNFNTFGCSILQDEIVLGTDWIFLCDEIALPEIWKSDVRKVEII